MNKSLELEPGIGGEGGDCVFERCKKCGETYGESIFDEHECEPEKDEEEIDIDDEPDDEKNDLDDCETIYCQPTCPKCHVDEGECDYICKNSPDYINFDNESDSDIEPESEESEAYEPSADFC